MLMEYSVIIPAYNEEAYLSKTLSALKTAMSSIKYAGEIIVVDNNSSDNTAEIAKSFETKLVFEPINQISRARNAGVSEADGRYLIFLDADTVISPDLLQAALVMLESGKCCGGGVLVNMDKSLSKTMQRTLDFWNWLSMRFGLAAGCFIYCLREGFEAIGGFSEKVYASEEIWFSSQLKSWGKKHEYDFRIISDQSAITSSRKLDWYAPWEILLLSLLVLLFPPAVCFRLLCFPWYRRP